jgi:predicted transcriptional regulator
LLATNFLVNLSFWEKGGIVTRKAGNAPRLLTETELELMNILWRLGEGTVNDVLAGLSRGRDLAYTSVSTILRILEQKRVVSSRKEGRGHVYVPRVTKEAYEATSLGHLLAKVFDDEPSTLVRRLVETRGLDGEELRKIRALLDRQLGEPGGQK